MILHRIIEQGIEQGQYQELYKLVQDGLTTLAKAAERKHLSEGAFLSKLKELHILEVLN